MAEAEASADSAALVRSAALRAQRVIERVDAVLWACAASERGALPCPCWRAVQALPGTALERVQLQTTHEAHAARVEAERACVLADEWSEKPSAVRFDDAQALCERVRGVEESADDVEAVLASTATWTREPHAPHELVARALVGVPCCDRREGLEGSRSGEGSPTAALAFATGWVTCAPEELDATAMHAALERAWPHWACYSGTWTRLHARLLAALCPRFWDVNAPCIPRPRTRAFLWPGPPESMPLLFAAILFCDASVVRGIVSLPRGVGLDARRAFVVPHDRSCSALDVACSLPDARRERACVFALLNLGPSRLDINKRLHGGALLERACVNNDAELVQRILDDFFDVVDAQSHLDEEEDVRCDLVLWKAVRAAAAASAHSPPPTALDVLLARLPPERLLPADALQRHSTIRALKLAIAWRTETDASLPRDNPTFRALLAYFLRHGWLEPEALARAIECATDSRDSSALVELLQVSRDGALVELRLRAARRACARYIGGSLSTARRLCGLGGAFVALVRRLFPGHARDYDYSWPPAWISPQLEALARDVLRATY